MVSATGTCRGAGLGTQQNVLPKAGSSVPVIPSSQPSPVADAAARPQIATVNTTVRLSHGEAGPPAVTAAADCNEGLCNKESPVGSPSKSTPSCHDGANSTSVHDNCTSNEENAPAENAACLATPLAVMASEGMPDPPLSTENSTNEGVSVSCQRLEESAVHQGSATVVDTGGVVIDGEGLSVQSGQDESVSHLDNVLKDQEETAVLKNGTVAPGGGEPAADGQERSPRFFSFGQDESISAQDMTIAQASKTPVDREDSPSHQCNAGRGSDSQHDGTEVTNEAWTAESEY